MKGCESSLTNKALQVYCLGHCNAEVRDVLVMSSDFKSSVTISPKIVKNTIIASISALYNVFIIL